MRAVLLSLSGATLVAVAGCGSAERPLSQSAELLVEAREALAAGDDEKALSALDDSIASQPMVWSHFERAKLRLRLGKEQGALEDCEAALKLSPEDREVLWLKGELQKPADKRFQGQFKNPPSYRK